MISPVSAVRIRKFHDGKQELCNDLIAAEEPLEIRLEWGEATGRSIKNIAVTMRTPGNDFELALGFLFTEGIIQDYSDVLSVRYCTDGGINTESTNTVRVALIPGIDPAIDRLQRNFYTTSSCGVCGKASIDSVLSLCKQPPAIEENDLAIDSSILMELGNTVRRHQTVFEHTGGIHAVGLFDTTGQLLLLREDVGRHNAMDKLIGAALAGGMLPLNQHILFLSGRSSFELIQKAAMAGIRIVAAVGAPSGLAVNMAKEFNITLLGFVRDRRFNVYCGEQRINT
jgi:FdhD protein